MDIKEYLSRKSNIIKTANNTTMDIATIANVVEVKQYKLDARGDATSCPYCMVFLPLGCEGCPAVTYDRKCADEGSRIKVFKELNGISGKIADSNAALELNALVDEYNLDLDNGINNGVI